MSILHQGDKAAMKMFTFDSSHQREAEWPPWWNSLWHSVTLDIVWPVNKKQLSSLSLWIFHDSQQKNLFKQHNMLYVKRTNKLLFTAYISEALWKPGFFRWILQFTCMYQSINDKYIVHVISDHTETAKSTCVWPSAPECNRNPDLRV